MCTCYIRLKRILECDSCFSIFTWNGQVRFFTWNCQVRFKVACLVLTTLYIYHCIRHYSARVISAIRFESSLATQQAFFLWLTGWVRIDWPAFPPFSMTWPCWFAKQKENPLLNYEFNTSICKPASTEKLHPYYGHV
jgi:hypothetical protein